MRVSSGNNQRAGRTGEADQTSPQTGSRQLDRVGAIDSKLPIKDEHKKRQQDHVAVTLSDEALDILDALEFGEKMRAEAELSGWRDNLYRRLSAWVGGLHEIVGLEEPINIAGDLKIPTDHLAATILDAVASVAARSKADWTRLHARIETRRADFDVVESPTLIPLLRRGHFRLIVNAAPPEDGGGAKTSGAGVESTPNALTLARRSIFSTSANETLYDHTLGLRFEPHVNVSHTPTSSSGSRKETPVSQPPSYVVVQAPTKLAKTTLHNGRELFDRMSQLLGNERVQWTASTRQLSLILDGALFDSHAPYDPIHLADFAFKPFISGSHETSGAARVSIER